MKKDNPIIPKQNKNIPIPNKIFRIRINMQNSQRSSRIHLGISEVNYEIL